MGARSTFGKLRRLPSGNWQASYLDPRATTPGGGDRITAPQTFSTKTAARAWLDATKTDIDRGVWQHPDERRAEREARERAEVEARRPFGPYAQSWVDTRTLTRATRDGYQSLLDIHLAPKWGDTPIRDITTAAVRAWVATLAPGHPGARRHAYELFKTIMATAVEDDLIDHSPCKRNMLGSVKGAGKSMRHAPRALSAEEVSALADEVPGYMRTVVLLLCVTGMRAGELRELRVKDVNLEAGTLSISRAVTGNGKRLTLETPKTAAGERVITLSPDTVALLRAHLAARGVAGREALLFPSSTDPSKHMPMRTLQINVRRACERLGLPHCSPHDFRHTAASLAGRVPGMSPKDVQEMLGQSTPGMALRYMKTDEEHQRRIAEAVAAEVLGSTSEPEVVALDERRRA